MSYTEKQKFPGSLLLLIFERPLTQCDGLLSFIYKVLQNFRFEEYIIQLKKILNTNLSTLRSSE